MRYIFLILVLQAVQAQCPNNKKIQNACSYVSEVLQPFNLLLCFQCSLCRLKPKQCLVSAKKVKQVCNQLLSLSHCCTNNFGGELIKFYLFTIYFSDAGMGFQKDGCVKTSHMEQYVAEIQRNAQVCFENQKFSMSHIA